jgi:hypothetical protein
VLTERSASDPDDEGLNANDHLALETLANIEVPGGIAYSEWKKAAIPAGVAERTLARSRKRLLDRGAVVNVGTDKVPRYVTSASASAMEVP